MIRFSFIIAVAVILSSCTGETPERSQMDSEITVPEGFTAEVIADSLGRARHLDITDNGDIYVAIRNTNNQKGGAIGLRDANGDGFYEVQVNFGHDGGTGIKIRDGYIYFASDTSVVRYRQIPNELMPDQNYETIVYDLPVQNSHAVKPFDFDDNGNIYVNVGAPSNACMEESRTPGSPGMDPCPLLESTGGIWQFVDGRPDQRQQDGVRYASGIRNAVALAWNHTASDLFIVQHGRDQLNTMWPDLYDEQDNAELPAEEFLRVEEGAELAWPYCYYDRFKEAYVLSPEYGGDGEDVGRCAEYNDPVVAFPAHYAPNDLIFYDGSQFPEKYHNGAFIAFHGSWNRAPEEQGGYKVVFVPFEDGEVAGEWEVFADNFAGIETIESPGDAKYRPVGLTTDAEGNLYISDSVIGRIWKVSYTGM